MVSWTMWRSNLYGKNQKMTEVYIALGSNLGDRLKNLISAVDYLKDIGMLQALGGLYRSDAYGFTEQPDFYNSVVSLKTSLAPVILLDRLKEIERKLGRKKGVRWGPREIDLDIIFYGQLILNRRELIIPHPDFHNRKFVLMPLVDIAENFISPTHRKSVLMLLKACRDTTRTDLIAKKWYINGIKI